MKKKSPINKNKTPKPKKYRIYGILNFKTNKLLYISLDLEQVELEFDLTPDYEKECNIVSADIMLF